MKKKIVAALAGLMVMAMGVTSVLAADSPATDGDNVAGDVAEDLVKDVQGATVEVNGEKVDLTVEPVSKTIVESLDDELAQGFIDGEELPEGKTTEVLAAFDLVLGDVDIPEGGLAVTIDVAGVSAGDAIVVMHQKADGTWEYLPTKVGDGYVVATFTSFSPVAIVAVVDAEPTKPTEPTDPKEPDDTENPDDGMDIDDNNNNDNNAPGTTTDPGNTSNGADNTNNGADTTSPKTGETNALPFVAAAILVGIVVCGKKVKKYA